MTLGYRNATKQAATESMRSLPDNMASPQRVSLQMFTAYAKEVTENSERYISKNKEQVSRDQQPEVETWARVTEMTVLSKKRPAPPPRQVLSGSGSNWDFVPNKKVDELNFSVKQIGDMMAKVSGACLVRLVSACGGGSPSVGQSWGDPTSCPVHTAAFRCGSRRH